MPSPLAKENISSLEVVVPFSIRKMEGKVGSLPLQIPLPPGKILIHSITQMDCSLRVGQMEKQPYRSMASIGTKSQLKTIQN